MARNMYGATSADFTLASGGRVVPGAALTLWTARTGGTQITDLLDVDSVACTTVTSAADGSVVYYGPNNDKTVHWADSGQGSRVAIRPTDITGDPPVMSIGTVGTGTAAASLTGTSEAPVLNLTLPSAGTNGVNTAAIQDGAVTTAKLADAAVTAAKLSAGLGGLLTTKGDLVARDASTAVRLPVGADGTVLQADAGSAAGVRWSPTKALSGTGAPEGVIAAAPGSTYLQTDATNDVKGWIKWIKATGTGSTGWVVGPEADTGWRKIVTWNSSGTITYGTATWGTNWAHAAAGALALRRAGDLTSLRMNYVKAVTTNPGTAIFNEWTTLVPEAFRPVQPLTPVLGSGLSAHLPVNTGIMSNIAANSYTVASDFVGQCYGAAWPASLPGTTA